MYPFIKQVKRRLRALLQGRDIDRDLAEEMQSHIEHETLNLQRTQGLSAADARRQAMMSFGGVDRYAEEHRDARGVRGLQELGADIRYSLRTLSRSPGFALSAILVLALGVGATTAMFSAVDAVILARLPYRDDHQLIRIFEQNSPTNRWTLSLVDVQAIEEQAQSFSAFGYLRTREVGVSAGHSPERMRAGYMNAGLMQALGVGVASGRALNRDDERGEAAGTIILGNAFAVRAFGSAQAAVDSTVTVDGVSFRVVGVLKPEDAHLGYTRADIWPVLKRATPARRGPFGMSGVARLKPGVTIEAARRELDAISVRIFPLWQAGFQDKVARLTPYSLREIVIGDTKRPLWLFTGAVALVLLIAVSNVASLSLVRSMRRWREVSLRSMLGASRGRLVRLMITESVVLATVSGVFGVGLGWVGLKTFQQFATGIPRLNNAHVDVRTVLVAMGVSIVSGIAIGIIPAFRLLRSSRDEAMRDGTRAIGDGAQSNRLRSAFVAAEFALALPVLAAGALLLNSLMQLQQVNPGIDTRGVQVVRVGVPSATYQEQKDIARFWQRALLSVRAIPGVTAAGLGTAIPPDDQGNNNNNYDLVDSPVPPGGAQPTVTWPSVTNEFFQSLKVPLIEGRLFSASDTVGGAPVVIVTQSWAKHSYPGRSALGRELIQGGCVTCPHSTIVGVVGDVTFDQLDSPGHAIFSPLSDGWSSQLNLFVRTAAADPAIERKVRAAISGAEPTAAMGTISSLDDKMYESLAQPRHWATILLTFAIAALLMAAVGVFGLLSYAVELRRREIGVRMALGAARSAVVGGMVLGGMRYAAIGAAIGIALTFATAKWLTTMLFGVSAFDLITLSAVTVLLLMVALLASWIPARRAAAIDPMEAMRPE